jgi:hypothetical protein
MSAFHLAAGCAGVICGIWGFVDVLRYRGPGRAEPQAAGRLPQTWVLFYRSLLPLTVGVVLIAGAEGSAAGGWVLNVTAVVLLVWLTLEEAGSWLRSRRQRRASASGS